MRVEWNIVAALATVVALGGCRPSDILSVPAPIGVQASSAMQSQAGAESAYNGAKGQIFTSLDAYSAYGLLPWAELLTDEFTYVVAAGPGGANVDARMTRAFTSFGEGGDTPWTGLLQARSSLVLALPLLIKYEPTGSRSSIGEAYALKGYDELIIAESYCAGTPFDIVLPQGGIQYGTPLTTDSTFGLAQADFNSAVANAAGDPSIAALGTVGLARALVDRGQLAAAATAVRNVPTSFVYNSQVQPNSSGLPYHTGTYAYMLTSAPYTNFNVSDREGGNGLDFVSAHDPRLLFDTSLTTADGTPMRIPLKFEANLAAIPLATGIEARLVEAEAALKAGQTSAWLNDLNALRNSGCTVSGTDTTCALGTGQLPSQTVGLPSLSDPGTDSGRVSLQFRERAFWLFGNGTRLGDLRRLIRQYGRDQSTVFPTGPYTLGHNPSLPAPIPNYGTDVSLTLPTPQSGATITNPSYHGCLSSPATP
jgi:hypothetical protein